jgi:hypothetical protein
MSDCGVKVCLNVGGGRFLRVVRRNTGVRLQTFRVRCEQPSPLRPSTVSTTKLGCKAPQNLLVASVVGSATEVLRYLKKCGEMFKNQSESNEVWQPPPPPQNIADILEMLRLDFTERAYFVTGVISQNMYAPDCLFVDPTISFRGTELYIQNLSLVVSFLTSPSIELLSLKIVRSGNSEKNINGIIRAKWILRTGVRLPWSPFVELKGTTEYEIAPTMPPLIIRHEEMWSISGYEALKMIFTHRKE